MFSLQAAASSTGREPTAKELQALFDELDELSDSGNEGVAADEVRQEYGSVTPRDIDQIRFRRGTVVAAGEVRSINGSTTGNVDYTRLQCLQEGQDMLLVSTTRIEYITDIDRF